jgi:hypothetical protein
MGKASATSFIRSLKQTIFQTEGEILPRASHDAAFESVAIHSVDTSAFSLPTRRQADYYMECFWLHAHPIFPILHKTSFVTAYNSIWLSEDQSYQQQQQLKQPPPPRRAAIDDPIFLSTLSIALALGCQFCDSIDPARKKKQSEEFYVQASKLFAIDDLDSVSLPLVQHLLLSGVYLSLLSGEYLHTSRYANRCWNTVGLAIRNAQSLGLHEEHIRQSQNQIERETRRRVWYSCFVLDRYLATVTFLSEC